MKPLQIVAWGMLVIVVDFEINGYDLVADPVGWLLVIRGVDRLPRSTPWRDPIQVFSALALVASVVLWFPGFRDALLDGRDWLESIFDLPPVALAFVLCLCLARLAGRNDDSVAASWLNRGAFATAATAVLPLVILLTEEPAVIVLLVMLALAAFGFVVVLLLAYAGRAWARTDPVTPPVDATR